jgi:hypothetical protein
MTDQDRLVLLADDYEKLRTKMLRLLIEQETLLSDCLSAARQPTPRMHVVDDHVDRSLLKARSGIEYLKNIRLSGDSHRKE